MSRWIVRGTLTTTTALHIGSGNTSEVEDSTSDEGRVARHKELALDVNDAPYVPGTSLKGVLRQRLEQTLSPWPEWAIHAFGALDGDDHSKHLRGRVEFACARLKGDVELGSLSGHARDRKTKAVANKKLFTTRTVPVGTTFTVELVVNEGFTVVKHGPRRGEPEAHFNFDDAAVGHLLWAMNQFDGLSTGITLGASTATGFGQIKWALAEVVRIPSFSDWLTQAALPSLNACANVKTNRTAVAAKAPNAEIVVREAHALSFTLDIPFASPFLSADFAKKKTNKGDPDFRPLRRADGKAVLLGTSLHGALRAQAERIARTVGIPVADGTQQISKARDELDVVALLFGAPSWKSPIKVSEFVCEGTAITHRQEFVAIDRFTGGASDGAKFNGESLLKPSMRGVVSIDWQRLEKASEPHSFAALGLLALTLRDLDEGDIGLGYGASAKGYGQVDIERSAALVALSKAMESNSISIEACVAAFRSFISGEVVNQAFVAPVIDSANAPNILGADAFKAPPGKSFHNPYQFLPVNKPVEKEQWLKTADFKARETDGKSEHHWHDRYATKTVDGKPVFSGRIVCTITTKTPTFVGAGQTPGKSNFEVTKVVPFKLGENYALPATSLRGMFWSLLEAASQSALRVMHDTELSVRVKTENAMSAIGRVVEVDGELRLEPLCLPTLKYSPREKIARIPKEYLEMFPDTVKSLRRDPFKCLFGDWRSADTNFLSEAQTHSPKKPGSCNMYYPALKIQNGAIDLSNFFNPNGYSDSLHCSGEANDNENFFLGIRSAVGEYPVAVGKEWDSRKELPVYAKAMLTKTQVVRGVLRNMGGQSVRSDMPNTRKHEVFLPMKYLQVIKVDGNMNKVLQPAEFKSTSSNGAVISQEQLDYFARGTFPIQAVALERFKSLANESTHTQDKKPNLGVNALLPYHPIGTRRNTNDTRELELKAGDLVYFRPSSDGKAVAEIAFSSIWRSRVESDGKAVSTKAFFQQISTELTPFSKERARISPAELMLGFVQIANKKAAQSQADVDKKITDPEVIVMAGKVRFSFGEFGTAIHEPRMAGETTLKILGAPKLPSPALYFKRLNAGNTSKADLSKNAKDFAPRGRKFYLHAMRQSGNVATINQQGRVDTKGFHPWKSHATAHDKNNNQRTCINPLAIGETFYCHIDFDNLSQTELALLCFAIKPLEGFEHRLGLGKPLGLGSIEVRPVAMGLIDRVQRYARKAISAARFDMLWQSSTVGELPTRYRAMQASPSAATRGNLFEELATAGAKATQSRDPALLRAINLLGHPDAVKLPVHTPQLEGLDLEGESFKWFVDNEGDTRHHKGAPQNLGAVDSRSEALPGMERVKRYERQDR